MKNKIFFNLLCILLLGFLFGFQVCAKEAINVDISGRWAEKISERVVADIYPDEKIGGYQVFITWREDNLAQKDIYRFKLTDNKDGTYSYKDGVHIYRFYNSKKYEDELDYNDGSGMFKLEGNELVWIDNKDNRESSSFIRANNSFKKAATVKNKLFSVMFPEELRGLYEVKTEKDKISIYDKSSKKAGFGGFAFGIKAYKNPKDHAILPGGQKIGELTDKKGRLYDMVLKYPTDVQYDYVTKKADSYSLLYDFGAIADIKGINGAKYYKNQGMKGKDLYKDILDKHVRAIKEKWDSTKLEDEDMSYMYNVLASSGADVASKIGYAYYDANADGIDELVIGEIADRSLKGVIYDMYTMVDRKPVHVKSGGARDRYFICNDTFICNEYSSGAMESGWLVYILIENSKELYPQLGFKYDEYENKKNPWFITYSAFDGKWDNVDEKTFKERKVNFDNYKRFDYIPFSTLMK